MEWFEMFNKDNIPMQEDVVSYINNQCFQMFHDYLTTDLKLKVKLEYSSCSLEKGWNIKYKKSGRNIIIVYPKSGFFRVLIALKINHELDFLNECQPYVKEVYENTDALNGSKWLIFDINDQNILGDIYSLIKFKINK